MEVRRRKATEKELEQGLREMRKAQERLEREEKENEELPLEDGKVEGQVEGEERLEIEDDPKRLLEGQGESEGKSTLKPPKSSPAALTPAKPGAAASVGSAVSRTSGQRRDEPPKALEDDSRSKVEENRTPPSATAGGRVGPGRASKCCPCATRSSQHGDHADSTFF
jgi:hypothetical protein